MKNTLKNFSKLAVTGCLAASFLLMAGCGGNKKPDQGGNEDDLSGANLNQPLVMSTLDPDGVFNPFFATSGVDSNILAQTQIGMLSTDKNGNLVCGQNEPSVAEDYSVRTVEESGQKFTYYQFIIKNNILFSDGQPLTIKDVLFNMYVYLDPVYTGAATMYSTDIVGLNDYRTDQEGATAESAAAFEENRRQEARARIDRLVHYVYFNSNRTPAGEKDKHKQNLTEEQIAEVKKDYVTVTETFRKELETDWTSVSSGMEGYKENNGFTHAWQVFLVNDGGFDLYQKNPDGTYIKDSQGNMLFDPDSSETQESQRNLTDYLAEKGITQTSGVEYEEAVKAWAIEYVYVTKFPKDKETVDDLIANTSGAVMKEVLSYWGTANTTLTDWTAEATTKYFAASGGKVKNISGITALKGGAFKASDESAKSKYSNDYDMLQIKIRGIDPKAIYNFSFVVAPMHYYSADNYVDDNNVTHNCISDFSVANNNFGVVKGDSKFFNQVLNGDKSGVPVGAGVYRATNANGDDNPTRTGSRGFWNNNLVYYKRNNYFTSVGTGIQNAKIKLLRYRVVASDQIIASLQQSEIHFGEPNATTDNIEELDKISGVTHVEVDTNGYGYVGVNARFVPNITVRRAIMKAMNRDSIVQNYYKGGLAEIIERPMTTTSWAYPQGAAIYRSKGTNQSFTDSVPYSHRVNQSGVFPTEFVKTEIQKMLDSLVEDGYTLNKDGLYANSTGDTLDYTFTIAGGSTDHPAYDMFLKAAALLNSCKGIRVKVETSSQALSDLTMGKLTVWAAAWTSTIDPDLYQVYHKDSKAASTLNWGYDYIKQNANHTYDYEQNLVNDLSKLITDARKTTVQSERTAIYKDALEKIMELAVELPVYQRKDMFAYRSDVIDTNTMQHDVPNSTEKTLTPYNSPLSRIWEVDYTQAYKDAHQ